MRLETCAPGKSLPSTTARRSSYPDLSEQDASKPLRRRLLRVDAAKQLLGSVFPCEAMLMLGSIRHRPV